MTHNLLQKIGILPLLFACIPTASFLCPKVCHSMESWQGCVLYCSLLSARPTAHPEPLLAYTWKVPFQEKTPFLGRGREGREKCFVVKHPLRSISYIILRLKPVISLCTKWFTEKERCREATNEGRSYLSHLQYQQSGPHLHHSKYCSEKRSPSCKTTSILLNISSINPATERREIHTTPSQIDCYAVWQSSPLRKW